MHRKARWHLYMRVDAFAEQLDRVSETEDLGFRLRFDRLGIGLMELWHRER